MLACMHLLTQNMCYLRYSPSLLSTRPLKHAASESPFSAMRGRAFEQLRAEAPCAYQVQFPEDGLDIGRFVSHESGPEPESKAASNKRKLENVSPSPSKPRRDSSESLFSARESRGGHLRESDCLLCAQAAAPYSNSMGSQHEGGALERFGHPPSCS